MSANPPEHFSLILEHTISFTLGCRQKTHPLLKRERVLLPTLFKKIVQSRIHTRQLAEIPVKNRDTKRQRWQHRKKKRVLTHRPLA